MAQSDVNMCAETSNVYPEDESWICMTADTETIVGITEEVEMRDITLSEFFTECIEESDY